MASPNTATERVVFTELAPGRGQMVAALCASVSRWAPTPLLFWVFTNDTSHQVQATNLAPELIIVISCSHIKAGECNMRNGAELVVLV